MKLKHPVAGHIILIEQENIFPNPNQPRLRFDFDELTSLAESIRHNGLLQPLTVRRTENENYFELVAGERRLLAARMVGLGKIPCIVMDISDEKSAIFSLIENIQRQDIGFFEEALAISKLIDRYHYSREELSRKIKELQKEFAIKKGREPSMRRDI